MLTSPRFVENLVGRSCRWKDGSGVGSQIVVAYLDRDKEGRVEVWVVVMDADGETIPVPLSLLQLEARHGMFEEAEERPGPRSSFSLPTSALQGSVPVSLAVFRDEDLAQLAEQCILTLTSRGNLPNEAQGDAVVAGEHIAKVGLYLDKERR